MDVLRTADNPWGQDIWVGISWDLVWIAAIASLAFVIGHAVLARLRAPGRVETTPPPDEVPEAERVERHSLVARAFHWTMSVAMFALLITAFVPVLGLEFDWVGLHWMAGLLLLATIIWHVIHTLGWQDLWSMWVGPADVRDGAVELKHAILPGGEDDAPPHRTGKYPADHKLYHHAAATAALAATATGLFMMVRIDTPFWTRNPYLFGDGTWGVVYVLHGLAGVGLIGLVAAHVYFAVRPEKRWLTWSMIRGWITRDRYRRHFDPAKWPANGVTETATRSGGSLAEAAPRAPRGDA